jgi:hypothetical protein
LAARVIARDRLNVLSRAPIRRQNRAAPPAAIDRGGTLDRLPALLTGQTRRQELPVVDGFGPQRIRPPRARGRKSTLGKRTAISLAGPMLRPLLFRHSVPADLTRARHAACSRRYTNGARGCAWGYRVPTGSVDLLKLGSSRSDRTSRRRHRDCSASIERV